MALFVQQNDNRTELQQRLATELQDKARKKAEEAELPDGVTDSQYMKNTQTTGRFAWVWIALGAAIVIAIIIFMIQTLAK